MTQTPTDPLANYRAERTARLEANFGHWPRLDGLDPARHRLTALNEDGAGNRLSPVALPSLLALDLLDLLEGLAFLGSERAELLREHLADAALASSMRDLARLAADENGHWGVAMRAIASGDMTLAADVLEAKADNVVPLARRPATLSP